MKPSSSTEPKANILVVDDTPENLRLLNQILSAHYRVRLVPGGRQALAAVQSTPPDMILLDIMMPDLNGFQVAEQVKAQEQTRDIPILFISALDDTDSKLHAFDLGGVDYITKPFQEREVLARVRTHLAIRNLQRSLEEANAALAQQVDALQVRNDELDAFAHTVAHDLKNPLSSVYLTTMMLADGYASMSPEEATDLLRSCVRVVEMMNRSIDGLMLLAGLYKQTITPALFEMAPVVTNTLDSLKHAADEAHAQVVTPPAWPAAMGYIPWVEEVWANYISNAIKYGGRPEQGIAPRIELGFDQPEGPGKAGFVRFWVRDNGPGLSAEQQAVLFTPFERLHNVRVKGHGLGLSIVQRLVQKMGGQVGIESIPDQGSTFYFTLPDGN
ncbi:MAG: hybrid sensor histidine kinase/response regulator [Anaerolineales bacterium]|nr:hybrid sensor histidine kinase/response regulator [Anaerolineales bacterium]